MNYINIKNKSYNEKSIDLLKIPRLIMIYCKNNNLLGKRLDNNKIEEIVNDFLIDKIIKNKIIKEYGIFITINENEKLRGCIGTFKLSDNLQKTIGIYTLESAFNDKRFKPIYNIDNLSYKINFLERPREIGTTLEDLEENIKIWDKNNSEGHGITLYFENNRSATYLASVLLDAYNVKNIKNLREKWLTIKEDLKKKANSEKYNIDKIEIYLCKEFNENDIFNLEQNGGIYLKYNIDYKKNIIY